MEISLEELNFFEQHYDRIEYLAKKIKKIRLGWIHDDWILAKYMKFWSNQV